MAELNIEDVDSLAEKVASLDLTEGERRALGTLLASAGQDAEVEGFGWDEGVAAVHRLPGVKGPELGAPLIAHRVGLKTGLLTDDGTLVL